MTVLAKVPPPAPRRTILLRAPENSVFEARRPRT